MTVSTKEYIGVPRDKVENFLGNQLVYLAWDQHLLFATSFQLCLPPQMTFAELVRGPLTMLLAPDPDAAAISWGDVEWLKGNEPFVPDDAKTLEENGIRHKEQLRMRTPGLNTLCGGS